MINNLSADLLQPDRSNDNLALPLSSHGTQDISFYSHLSEIPHPNYYCVLSTLITMSIVCTIATLYIIFYYIFFL